jgi:Fe-S oxidoreductase
MVKLLKAAGISFGVLGKQEGCCGEPARRLGNEYVFQLEAEENIALFNELGVKRIITLCPHGYHVFKNEYPDFGGHYDVFHYTEIIQEAMDRLSLDTTPTSLSVTYHDPCYLGRYNGIYEAPRKVIQKSGGILTEMAHHGKRSLCCGGGGGVIAIPEADETRMKAFLPKVEQLENVGAETVVTACSTCRLQFIDGSKYYNLNIEVRGITEMVAAALDTETPKGAKDE